MAFDVFKNINRSMFGVWMKEVLERIEGYFDQVQTSIDTLDPLPTNASAGQVLKYNGSEWVADTDLTTGGTGVMISGTASPPASGTGSNGDYYMSTVTGLMFGPKAAGAWPSSPINVTGAARKAREIPTILPFGNRADITLNAALQTNYVELEPFNPYLSPVNLDAHLGNNVSSYRTAAPILIPRYGQLTGRNSWILNNWATWSEADFSPVVGWAAADGGIGAAQDMSLGVLRGVNVDGGVNQGVAGGAAGRVIGITSGLLTTSDTSAETGGQSWVAGSYLLTHARNIIEDCSAQQCYYGFLLTMDQYSVRRNLKAGGGNKVGFVHWQSEQGGGMVDMPEMSQLLCWGQANTVGHLFIFNTQSFPVHPYILRGSWAKGVGCAYAFVWNPAASPANFGHEVILDSGSTEYNTAGVEGLDATFDVDCIGRADSISGDFFTYAVRKVELDIDEFIRVVCRDYTFQDGDGLGWAYLRGQNSRVALQGDTTVAEQVRMAVRSAHVGARVLFEDCTAPTGGCWENVGDWNMTLRNPLDGTTSNRAAVFCGWADPELVSTAPTELATATFTNRVAPNFSASENGVTVSTVLDSSGADPSGNTVTVLSFPSSKSAGERALTPWLGGGGSAKSYSDGGNWSWTFVQLKNMHGSAVRIVPYLRTAAGFVRGADPSHLGGPVESAVTLWPDQWMVVAILTSWNADTRLCIERADTTTTAFDIRATKLSHVRLPLSKRFHLNRAIQRLIYV